MSYRKFVKVQKAPVFKVSLCGDARSIGVFAAWLEGLNCEPKITPRNKRKYHLRCNVPQEYAEAVARAIALGAWPKDFKA